MKKSVWMLVTKDKYELPILTADSAAELARKVGVSVCTVYNSVHENPDNSKYRKVEIGED